MERRLLASAGGAIGHLLLFAPAYEAEHFSSIYGALVASLPGEAEITVVAENGARPFIENWPCAIARIAIVDAGDACMTPWARDPLLAGDAAVLATPVLARRDDARASARFAGETGLERIVSAVPFEGGNILVGDDHVLVGVDTLSAIGEDGEARFRKTLEAFEGGSRTLVAIGSVDEAPAQRELAVKRGDEHWREIFHYRAKQGTRQPVFHIDMFLTLAGRGADGRERVLVGDPALAAALLGLPMHPLSLADRFDAIAGDLAARGFAVTRNPLPMIFMDEIGDRRRVWYYASSNNALVQRSPDIVWLPAFGHDHWPELAATDMRNREIWESLGFEVRMIGEAQKLAENLGGLHCLTNVLRRS